MKVGTIRGHNDLKALRYRLNDWCVVAIVLGQANYACLAAERTAQVFGPLIGHANSMRAELWKPLFADP
jgi:hypothetical protein